jgi:hypothetical protein
VETDASKVRPIHLGSGEVAPRIATMCFLQGQMIRSIDG